MPNSKLPVTRRDRVRLLKKPSRDQRTDENKNETRRDSGEKEDVADHNTVVTSNNAAALTQQDAAYHTKLQDIELRLQGLQEQNGRRTGSQGEDVPDVAPTRIGVIDEEAAQPGVFDIVGGLLGIGFYAYDIFTDARLAYTYYQDSKTWWFGLTTMFIVLPTAVMTSFNLCFYMMDMFVVKDSVSCCRWLLRGFFSMLMLGPVIRMFETLDYACRSICSRSEKKRKEYANKYIDAEVDSALIGMLEAFMEAGPQVVLQLYVFEVIGWTTDTTHLVTHQLKSIGSSLWMLAWAMVRFQKAVITSQSRNKQLSFCESLVDFIRSSVFMCLWRLFTISCRVLALATFAACFSWYVIVFCGVHYLIMLIWVCLQPTQYFVYVDDSGEKQHDKCLEATFKVFAAFIHIFAFLNLVPGCTRLRAIFFYTILYAENCALISLWYFYGRCSTMGPVASTITLAVVLGGFWVGIAFMGLHYKCCHTNKSAISCCVSCSDMKLCSVPRDDEQAKTEEAADKMVV